eukprot:snap_masked-scaffold_29-processed-gene-3.16-mRNA-1 protein AED:0.96 eAED:1.00 QI:0/-1/0/1/-1/1/1/0/169
MESKYSEHKEEKREDENAFLFALPGCGKNCHESILKQLTNFYCTTSRKENLKPLKKFAAANHHLFKNSISLDEESKTDNGEGNRHELLLCHKKFLKQLEDSLEGFLDETGLNIDDFLAETKMLLKGKDLTLFYEGEESKWFLEALYSSFDYIYFHKYMQREHFRHSKRK